MSKNNVHGLEVGQRLWFVRKVNRSRYGENDYFVQISKVGRKWAEFSRVWADGSVHDHHVDGRLSLDSLKVDGGDYSSPGTCYLSKGTYDEELEREELFNKLGDFCRKGLSSEHKFTTIQLLEAMELLGCLGKDEI